MSKAKNHIPRSDSPQKPDETITIKKTEFRQIEDAYCALCGLKEILFEAGANEDRYIGIGNILIVIIDSIERVVSLN